MIPASESLYKDPKMVFRVSWFGNPVRQRQFMRFNGFSADESVSAFLSSVNNAMNAVENRVFFRKDNLGAFKRITEDPRTANGPYDKYLGRFKDALIQQSQLTSPIPAELLAGMYQGAKRRLYERAKSSLDFDPVLTGRDYRIQVFLKYEVDIRSLKPLAVPRVISPPGVRYRHRLATYVKKIEHQLYDNINNVFGYTVVAKGLNYETLGSAIENSWNAFHEPASIDLDVSRLDQSITVESLAFVREIIGSFYQGYHHDDVMGLLEKQFETRALAVCDDGKFSYNVTGTLNSGQPNTSIQGVVAVVGILYALFERLPFKVRLINCGDDCTLICSRGDAQSLMNALPMWFGNFDMRIEMSSLNHVLEGIEFCQTHPVLVNGVYRMVRDPFKGVIKDLTCIDKLDRPVLWMKWLQGVAQGGMATHGGVPIFQSLYKGMLDEVRKNSVRLSKRQRKNLRDHRMIRSLEKSSVKYWGKGMDLKYTSITDATRFSMYLAYGYQPQVQIEMEKHLEMFSISPTDSQVGSGLVPLFAVRN